MKVLVTGATGFVGRWLTRELGAADHEVHAAPGSASLDIADPAAVEELVREAAPDVIAHLAAVASSLRARDDPARAIRTNVGGTIAVIEAARRLDRRPGLLIVSSAEVYAVPRDPAIALDEDAPLVPRTAYGMLKRAQEAVALEASRLHDLPLVVARPFSHVGPGQPPIAAVPSFAARIAAVRRGDAAELRVGNIDVERDIGDVRDVVVAYRLMLEGLADGSLGRPAIVLNVATGRPTSLRWVVEELSRQAGVTPHIAVDRELVRAHDPPRIVGDATRLRELSGWRPHFEPAITLADILDEHLARS